VQETGQPACVFVGLLVQSNKPLTFFSPLIFRTDSRRSSKTVGTGNAHHGPQESLKSDAAQIMTASRLLIFRHIPFPADISQVAQVNKPRQAVGDHQVLMIHNRVDFRIVGKDGSSGGYERHVSFLSDGFESLRSEFLLRSLPAAFCRIPNAYNQHPPCEPGEDVPLHGRQQVWCNT
jgi:hypothetical protein